MNHSFNFEDVYQFKEKEMANINEIDILKLRVHSTKNNCDIIQRLKKDDDQVSQMSIGMYFIFK